jgi:hypothetical protein
VSNGSTNTTLSVLGVLGTDTCSDAICDLFGQGWEARHNHETWGTPTYGGYASGVTASIVTPVQYSATACRESSLSVSTSAHDKGETI